MTLRHGLVVLLLPLSALFFVGGPSETAVPALRHLWNFGHIIAFALATFAWHSFWQLSLRKNIVRYLVFIIALSFVIESAQLLVGRDFSLLDIARNAVGACLALLLIAPRQTPWPVFAFALVLFLIDASGLAVKTYQDIRIQTRKPIIDNFEDPWLVKRWQGQITLSELYTAEGRYSAKVTFAAGKYPGITLWPTLRQWLGYSHFQWTVFNPSQQDEKLILRIDDIAHAQRRDANHNDRYNQAFMIKPGRNDISIALADITKAPANRRLNLNQVHQIILFMTDVEQEKTLYIDALTLTQQ